MNYLSTKITNKDYVWKKFPENPQVDDVIDWFKSKGFKDISDELDSKHSSYSIATANAKMCNAAKTSDCPIYMLRSYQHCKIAGKTISLYWIRFCDKGKVNRENPIMFIYLSSTGDLTTKIMPIKFDAFNDTASYKMSYEDMAKYIEERF